MPTGYQRHSAGPMRTSGTFVPPVDDLADSLLRARVCADNPDPFTQEHIAAYHAFANVTDRKDARDLHRAHVSWDDVNEYGAAGLSFTAYAEMAALRRDGVTPAVLRTWTAALPMLTRNEIRHFTRAGLTTTQVAPYVTEYRGTIPVAPLDRNKIPALIDQGISAVRVHHYQRCGVVNASNVLDLDHMGCRPKVLYGMLRNNSPFLTPDDYLRVNDFITAYRTARRSGATAHYCNALFPLGATADVIAAWHATDAPIDSVGVLHAAGITPAEYTANPAITDDAEGLATLAALRGHTVEAPTRTTAMLAA